MEEKIATEVSVLWNIWGGIYLIAGQDSIKGRADQFRGPRS